METLSAILLEQWQKIRQLTYDYLDHLSPQDLAQKLPFPEAQTLGYQFWCMAGAHESYLRKLKTGKWQGFSSSLSQFEHLTPAIIAQQMHLADEEMVAAVSNIHLEDALQDGQPGYEVVMQMIKHEMHHHGQLINLMYYLHLPIPPSWNKEWALRYDD